MKMLTRQPLVFLFAGFALWLLAFSLFYAIASIGCARGWDRSEIGLFNVLRLLLALCWLAFFPVLTGLYSWCKLQLSRQSPNNADTRFLWQTSMWSIVAAAAATAWIGPVIFFTSLCV